MDVDQMLAHCGDFGRYQFMLLSLFCVINWLSSMHYYSQTIISFVPDHWCYSEKLENLSYVEIEKLYSSYPDPHCTSLNDSNASSSIRNWFTNNAEPKRMSSFFVDYFNHPTFNYSRISDENETNKQNCNKWIYNLDYGYQSMTSDLNWVCNSAWKSTLGQSMFFIGSVIGTLLFGILADKIGRLPVLILANMMALIGNIATIFTNNVAAFSICRFVSGLATDSNFVMMYILVLEYIRPSMRTFGLNLCIGVFYCIGSIITPWIAVVGGSWKFFLLTTATPIFVVPLFYFIMLESAQWLIAKNDIDGAIKCFTCVAKYNGKILDPEIIDEFRMTVAKHTSKSVKNNSSIVGLFRTPRLRKHTIILLFKSMVITLCYDAISRNVEGLGLSPFILFSLSATAIFPACLVLLILQDKIGRKAMASSSLLISGIFTMATGIIIVYQGVHDPILLACLAIIGRFGVTVAYNSSAQYATELIPTCVRGQGVAAVHVAGYGLTFFSSYILFLANIFKPLPQLILGILSLAGAFVCLFLPETLNRIIPCTLEDGERFGYGEKIFDFSFSKRNKTKSNSTMGLQNQD